MSNLTNKAKTEKGCSSLIVSLLKSSCTITAMWVITMAQWDNILDTKPDYLSSVPRANMVAREK